MRNKRQDRRRTCKMTLRRVRVTAVAVDKMYCRECTYVSLHEIYCLFLSFFKKLEFSRQIFEKYSKNFTKIRAVGAELFHADGETVSKCRFSQFYLKTLTI
jgi:hypothetical protein